MKSSKSYQSSTFKVMYEYPRADIVRFSCADIIAQSPDTNQGEWDPQAINVKKN